MNQTHRVTLPEAARSSATEAGSRQSVAMLSEECDGGSK